MSGPDPKQCQRRTTYRDPALKLRAVVRCQLVRGHEGDHLAAGVYGGTPGRIAWSYTDDEPPTVERPR